jgi:ATP-binding cassette subfamily C protein
MTASGGDRPAPWTVVAPYLRSRPATLTALAGWSLVESLPALASGAFLALAIDEGFARNLPLVGLGYLALVAGTHIVAGQATRRIYPLVGELAEAVRDGLLTRVVTGLLSGAATSRAAVDTSVVSRMTQQVETARDVLAGLLVIARRTVFAVLAAVIGLTVLEPLLLAAVVPPLVVVLSVFVLLLRPLVRRHRAQVLTEERVAEVIGQVVVGLRDVAAFRAEDHVVELAGGAFERHRFAVHRLAALTSARTTAVALGAYVPVVVLLALAPALGERGVTAGALVGAVTYLVGTVEPTLRALTLTVGGSALRLAVALHRIAETSEAVERAPLPPATGSARPRGTDVELRGVSFAYGPEVEPVIRALDLRLAAGSHWAVVGPSGIGKSTLAGLLSGLDQPQQGCVTIGGAALTDHRRLITLVPQEPYVFDGTLRENLCYLRPDATDGEVAATVTLLGAECLLRGRVGVDRTIVAVDLDAAQRQLVALVRAYLSPAPVIVLDEATCHLDPVSEAVVEQAFAERGGTLVVIAHRMSSAMRAGHVLVLDGTASNATGTHESLRRSSGAYAELAGWWADPVAAVHLPPGPAT